jgi:hypothetical protein
LALLKEQRKGYPTVDWWVSSTADHWADHSDIQMGAYLEQSWDLRWANLKGSQKDRLMGSLKVHC